jgi:hypothetical protein
MEAYILRVERRKAGRSFPFDRIYLIRDEDRNIVERLFRYALVLPLEDALKKRLLKVALDFTIDRPHHRTETYGERHATKTTPADMSRFDEGVWLVVVPLLPKWVKAAMPRYLVAKTWYDERAVKIKGVETKKGNASPFTNRAFLQTPKEKIRPICVLCPRQVLHRHGECEIGQDVCYEHLPLGLENHFQEGLDVPEATPNVKETEELAVTTKPNPLRIIQ